MAYDRGNRLERCSAIASSAACTISPRSVDRAVAQSRAVDGAQKLETNAICRSNRSRRTMSSTASRSTANGRYAGNVLRGRAAGGRDNSASSRRSRSRTRLARRRDRRTVRCAHGRDRVPGDARQHRAHRKHVRGGRARIDAPPPELEVARMPTRRHRAHASRAAAVERRGRYHPLDGRRLRLVRSAEPMLNAWAAKLLGDPRKTRCTVERLDPATGAVVDTRVLHARGSFARTARRRLRRRHAEAARPSRSVAHRDRAARALSRAASAQRLRCGGDAAYPACDDQPIS